MLAGKSYPVTDGIGATVGRAQPVEPTLHDRVNRLLGEMQALVARMESLQARAGVAAEPLKDAEKIPAASNLNSTIHHVQSFVDEAMRIIDNLEKIA